jgi:anaerobic magnesium-protoporphyrin IX monomethyl ester cyclase
MIHPNVELIIPPNPYLGDPMRNAPLGLLYIAAVIEQANVDVGVVDLRNKSPEDFENEIGHASIYGITATTPDYPAAIEIAKVAKRKNLDAWAVLGGVHATCLPEIVDPIFDKVVIGEGEQSILEVLKDCKAGYGGRRYYRSAPIENLDELPFPAWHLLPLKSAFSDNALFVGAGSTATIITSRGCPYACSFCSNEKLSGRRTRFRSPQNVLAEIKYLMKQYGIRNFRFHDDTLTVGKDRLMKICEGLKPLGIRWRAETRVDQVSPEVLGAMKDAGCEEIAFGVESLSQKVLDRSHKRIMLCDVYSAIDMVKKVGMQVRLYFMIGLLGEPLGFADRLIKFCEETKPDAVDLSTFVPFPGSAMYEHPESFGLKLIGKGFQDYIFTKGLGNSETESDFTFQHDVMTNDELKAERRKTLEYLKARRMVKNY